MRYPTLVRSRRVLTLALLLVCGGPLFAQSSIGFSTSAAYANRTIRTESDINELIGEGVKERTSGAIRPSFAIGYERQLTRLLAVDVQLRYHTAGYQFETGNPRRDPESGATTTSLFDEINVRYDFVALPIGASEIWGSGAWRYYIEEFVVPMLYVATTEKTTIGGSEGTTRTNFDRVNDFHLGVRAGLGFERMLNSILRLRLGVVGQYNFTLTNDNATLREHLYSFGPQVSLARVFGGDAVPGGDPDDIYY